MIITFLDDLKDHRRSQGQRYELRFIVLFSIMAILSNAKSYGDIARFIEKHFRNLQKDFGLKWNKNPAYTTVRNIIQGIDKQELESCFRAYAQSLLAGTGNGNPVGVAVDGKVLRGSYDHFQDKKALQVLSFFDTQSELILAHETIDVKTNEIPVAQALIPQLGLEGVVYTLDALHCQKKTFEIAGNENMEEKKTHHTGQRQSKRAFTSLHGYYPFFKTGELLPNFRKRKEQDRKKVNFGIPWSNAVHL
jgi:predicted transposase YbfD/YdcC